MHRNAGAWATSRQHGPRLGSISPLRSGRAEAAVENVAAATEAGDKTLLLLGGAALTEPGLRAASRISAATGARLLVETFPARLEAGAGLPAIERLAYIAEAAQYQLGSVETLVLVGAGAPVSFFAYPGKTGDLVSEGCAVVRLSDPDQDVVDALERQYDAFVAAQENRSLLARDEDLPSGDELGAEFERFLAEHAEEFKEGDELTDGDDSAG